ncbi:hypothetical protein [Segetibacter aerophilus]|uniref:Uncharacterized protein n=1 Tax=Segetibacter aerophilus TaxID=670293 RepID=A0A512B910_9BACT|nr:hypothetical protein [Segetibacter aerophilus]GEO08451.1 hypothetical protein SAE01_09470 [Segetibacter aerophilus]
MKLIFTLFSILLLTINSLVAQTKSTQKLGLTSKNKSSYPPKKGTTLNSKKQGSPNANKSNLSSVTDDVSTESSAKNNVTGIWKGYFVSNSFGFIEDRYRFEVQLAQLPNDALNGVTYSYKTTVFYGKAEAKGINTTKTNNIILNELKLVDLKITEKSEPCLMTCYLEYNKMGELETLTGTYSSRNANDKGDCGTGKVYLEKKPTSDFYKEEFVIKRENELKKRTKSAAVKAPSSNKPSLAKAPAPKKPAIKPGAEQNLIPKPERKTLPSAPETVVIPKKEQPAEAIKPPVIKNIPKPEILKSRENEIVKTITTRAKEFKIDLYDNGEIDGDRITVYHNNQLIVSNKTLTDKPISFTIKADEGTAVHEFVMVAENLGSIPPNTALMIVTAGTQRYELFVTSTEQKNAVVRIVYQPE